VKVEIIPLVVNVLTTAFYVFKADEPGKLLYWLGASIVTVGLYLMRG
jgi:hypothetical protein